MTAAEVMAWWEIGSGDLYEAALQHCMKQGTLKGAELEEQLVASPALQFLKVVKFAGDEKCISSETMERLIMDVWVGGKIPITRSKPESIAPAMAEAMSELLARAA